MSSRITQHTVQIKHNFETAHRLYTQPKNTKCWSLHGHSMWATISIGCPYLDDRSMGVEFGELKKEVRGWLDSQWDHGTILNGNDPLVEALKEQESKVYTLPTDPTIEALSEYLYKKISMNILPKVAGGDHCHVDEVYIQETFVNGAGYVC